MTPVSSCRMICAVMYGVDSVRQDAEVGHGAAGEQVQHLDEARARPFVQQAAQRLAVDARHRDVRGELVDHQDEDREENLIAKVGQPNGVTNCF